MSENPADQRTTEQTTQEKRRFLRMLSTILQPEPNDRELSIDHLLKKKPK